CSGIRGWTQAPGGGRGRPSICRVRTCPRRGWRSRVRAWRQLKKRRALTAGATRTLSADGRTAQAGLGPLPRLLGAPAIPFGEPPPRAILRAHAPVAELVDAQG